MGDLEEVLLGQIGKLKSDLTNQLVRDKGEIVYDFNSATISGNSNWETSQSHTKLTSESIKPVSFNESNMRGLTVNQELEFENRTYGLYVYVVRENITNINISINFFNGATNVFSKSFNHYGMRNGWNYLQFDAIETRVTKFNIMFTVSAGQSTEIYLDSIVKDKKHKPFVILNFDSSSKRVHDVVYPILRSRGLVANCLVPTSFNSNMLSASDLEEMIDDGWDYSIYAMKDWDTVVGTNVNTWKTYTNNESNRETILANIKALVDDCKTNGFPCPSAYHSRGNYSSQILLDCVSSLGIPVYRASYGTYINEWSKSTMEVNTVQIQDDSYAAGKHLSDIKGYIDYCISNNCGMTIFTHDVVDSADSTGLNCSVATFTALCDYIKAKKDAGQIEVINFKEFAHRYNRPCIGYGEIDVKRFAVK